LKKSGIWGRALIGASITAPWMTLLYLGLRLIGFSFPPFDLFDLITRFLPGYLVTAGLEGLLAGLDFLKLEPDLVAKIAEQGLAIFGYFCLGTLLAMLLSLTIGYGWLLWGQKYKRWIAPVIGTPLILASVFSGNAKVIPLLNVSWLVIMLFLWESVLLWVLRRLFGGHPGYILKSGLPTASVETINRRQFLVVLGAASLSITVTGSGVAAILNCIDKHNQTDYELTAVASQVPLPNKNDPVKPAPGTRSEYTPVEDHYKVSIHLDPTVIDEADWRLSIQGLVKKPLSLSLDDLRASYPAYSQYVTLACISGGIPTTLIGTTLWTGVSVREVLATAGLKPDGQFLIIKSVDGYYETLSLETLFKDERIMFCYAWDGKPLPVEHGFPLRIWIPDRFGMKQPKWIDSIEVSDRYQEGYWVRRGWDEIAQVKARSEIDTIAVDEIEEIEGRKLVPVGGIAYAGARGISMVELRIDNGDWLEVNIRKPLYDTTWVVWRYDWPFEPGVHEFEVRCFEASGRPQISRRSPPHPSGATGLHKVKIVV
jgi:DMSO/TMAO reductase YedYZ molybdopterin-dependent catalytic subunit